MTRPVRRILATSGGFRATSRWGVLEPAGTMTAALRLTGQVRPKLCFVLTASGDDPSYLARMYSAFRGWSVDLTHLSLFTQPNADPRELLLGQDLIWVGGGSVTNLLAVWRAHGVDEVMRQAWEDGVVLGGVSAGSICWHVGGPTDSFGPQLRLESRGLGLLPFGNGVHYDSEEQRRPLLHALVAEGQLPLSYATDDGIGLLYEGTEPVEVIADTPDTAGSSGSSGSSGSADPDGPAAYRVEVAGGVVSETALRPGRLT
jgi:peptidase E